jgi:NAD-dependent SIR2 family protein deacetylase
MSHEETLDRAAGAVAGADALLIGAGAGMGVDSGLPDFRGREGFWKAYPPYQKLGLNFMDLANPRWFRSDPERAWGFYGHRLNLYRAARPHPGFAILRKWAARMAHGAFVFTSNVDGQFQLAGFGEDEVMEVHGSIHWLQCTRHCGVGLFASGEHIPVGVVIDEETVRARPPLPRCPDCGELARPNILMFGDGDWDECRTAEQHARLGRWRQKVGGARLVVVECGAGTAIPSVRDFCERAADVHGATLIRINPREPQVPRPRHVGLALGASEALEAIDQRLGSP